MKKDSQKFILHGGKRAPKLSYEENMHIFLDRKYDDQIV